MMRWTRGWRHDVGVGEAHEPDARDAGQHARGLAQPAPGPGGRVRLGHVPSDDGFERYRRAG
jgi:hypothetical protein